MSDKKSKQSLWDRFAISDEKSCRVAIRNGGIASLISGILTGIFAVSGFFNSSDDEQLNLILNPWNLIDCFLLFVLSIFIFNKSRIASTLMVIYFVASRVIIWTALGSPRGLLKTAQEGENKLK